MAKADWSLEQLTEAVIQTALSFFYHDPHVQYDSNPMLKPMGWKIRRCDTRLTAEQCGPDNLLYTVCSDLVHRVYRDAANYYLAPTSLEYWCVESTKTPADDPITVYKYDADTSPISAVDAAEECFRLLQPGDVLIYFASTPNASGGHAMLYIGDYFGDGNQYILHSCAPHGGKFNMDTGVDPMEPYGSIQLQTTEEICFHPVKKILGTRYLGLTKRFVLHRPLAIMAREGCALTPAAQTRLQYKGLEIWKTLDRSQYSQVLDGGTVSVSITVTNHGTEPYRGLSVVDPIPAGQTVVSVIGGGTVEDGCVRWTVEVAPEEIAILRYTVKISGQPGDILQFPAGTVGNIPTRTIPLKIGAVDLTDAQKQALSQAARSAPHVAFRDLDTVNQFYRETLGIETHLPKTLAELLDSLLTTCTPDGADDALWTLKPGAVLPKYLLVKHIAGRYYYDGPDMEHRVLEYLPRNYLPGDVLVCLTGDSTNALRSTADIVLQFILNDERVLTVTEDGASVGSFESTAGRDLRMNLLLGLRPTLS